MKLFVGLGNPGREYAFNRHNVGFMAVDAIAAAHDFPAWRRRFQGVAAEGRLGGEPVLLFKPETFMNESGRAVGEAVRFYKLELDDVVVFHDELDLAPGKVRVKTGGGVAGHNGLKSLTAHIGNDYVRVRIGIGHPGAEGSGHGLCAARFRQGGSCLARAPARAPSPRTRPTSPTAPTISSSHAWRMRFKPKPAPAKKPARAARQACARRNEQRRPRKRSPSRRTLAGRLRRWFGS